MHYGVMMIARPVKRAFLSFRWSLLCLICWILLKGIYFNRFSNSILTLESPFLRGFRIVLHMPFYAKAFILSLIASPGPLRRFPGAKSLVRLFLEEVYPEICIFQAHKPFEYDFSIWVWLLSFQGYFPTLLIVEQC